MIYTNSIRRNFTPRLSLCALSLALLLMLPPAANAASWNGIEPFKSRRADVERALGKPLSEKMGEGDTLRFRVAGGTATVAFVTRRFVETKKLASNLEGTVLQIILQHDNASDTPETLKLTTDKNFEREQRGASTLFGNTREGVFYMFVNNRLKTTRYTITTEQQKG